MNRFHKTCTDAHNRLPSQTWDTADVPEMEAFDFYREGICSAFMPLRPELRKDRRAGFRSKLTSYRGLNGTLNTVSADAHQVNRGPAEIAASGGECCYLNLQLGGLCRIVQGGSEITLRHGEIGLFDGATSFTLEHEMSAPLQVASLMIPKSNLRSYGIAMTSSPSKLTRNAGYGSLLRISVETLVNSAANASQDEFSTVFDIVSALVALTSAPDRDAAPVPARRVAQLLRAKRAIARSCTEPDYSIQDLGAEIALSVGYIRNIFTEAGETFGGLLLRNRLELASRLLTQPDHAHLPIATIAFLSGFKDASHFGRSFRDRYGVAPGEWRRARG